jgi:hypothetical protein
MSLLYLNRNFTMSDSIARTEQPYPTASWNASVPNPHDAFFKAIMTDSRMAKTF